MPTLACRALLVLVVTFAAAGCGDRAGVGGGILGGNASRDAARAGVPAIGDPLAKLPAPSAVPAGDRIVTAVSLATQVRRGGDEGAAALLTALRLAGIGVRGAGGEMLVDPVRPYQGTIVEAWEIRPLVALAREERTVLVPLEELALLIRTITPRGADAAVEAQLLEGIRQHATDAESPLHFWANFVVALGGDGSDGGTFDLLAVEDPKQAVLNGLQASLITRRLGTDLLVRANPPRAESKLLAPLRWLAPRPLYAATAPQQCQLSDTQQKIMDLVAFGSGVVAGGAGVGDLGFGGLVEALLGKGSDLADAASVATKAASAVLAYGQFVMTYLSVEAEIALDDGPLPRTREVRPQTGERRNLVAVVTMNTGDKQAVNCFRMMFNSVGLDFSLPQGGPAKGATVAWRGVYGFNQAAEVLHGGPEAIVQFVDDPANRIQNATTSRRSTNAIINQKVADDGTVRVGVEGRGQKQALPRDVGRVTKDATVGIQVALKGADIFGDMKDAASAGLAGAAGLLTMPLDLLYRMKWYSAAQHTFPVLDWGEGKGWSGTVDVILRAAGDGARPMMPAGTYQATRSTRLRFDFTNSVGSWQGQEALWNYSYVHFGGASGCNYDQQDVLTTAGGWGPAVLEVGEEMPADEDRPAEDGDRPVAGVSFGYDAERTALGISSIQFDGQQKGMHTSCAMSDDGPIMSREAVDGEAGAGYYPFGSTYFQMPDPMRQTELRGSAAAPWSNEEGTLKGVLLMSWKLRRAR